MILELSILDLRPHPPHPPHRTDQRIEPSLKEFGNLPNQSIEIYTFLRFPVLFDLLGHFRGTARPQKPNDGSSIYKCQKAN